MLQKDTCEKPFMDLLFEKLNKLLQFMAKAEPKRERVMSTEMVSIVQ